MKLLFSIAVTAATIGLASPALSAEVDMSKLTCKEVGAMPAGKTIRYRDVDERLCAWQSRECRSGR